MHPLIEEICRAKSVEAIRSDVFRRWQQSLRDQIQPMLDELDALNATAPAEEQPQATARKGRVA